MIWIKTERSRKTLPEKATRDFVASLVARTVRIGFVGLVIALIPVVMVIWQTVLITNQTQQIKAQNQLAESNRRSSLVFLMSNIMDKVDQEIKADCTYQKAYRANPDTNYRAKLSKPLEGRIIALSKSLKPYRYLEGNSMRKTLHSPEREQLLTSLIESNVHMGNIATKGNFAYAANLEAITLYDLWKPENNKEKVNLKGVGLNNKYLIRANLRRVDLNWADLSGADLSEADLRRANLSEADLKRANLSEADLRRADLSEANLIRADLFEANLSEANLSEADLRGVYLIEAFLPIHGYFKDALLDNSTKINNAVITDSTWLENIDKQISNYEGSPFNSKKYKLVKLSEKEIRAIKEKYKNLLVLRFLNTDNPLYQIRLKPGQKEEY